MPEEKKPRLAVMWRGRVFLGDTQGIFFMSQVSDPNDWSYSPTATGDPPDTDEFEDEEDVQPDFEIGGEG